MIFISLSIAAWMKRLIKSLLIFPWNGRMESWKRYCWHPWMWHRRRKQRLNPVRHWKRLTGPQKMQIVRKRNSFPICPMISGHQWMRLWVWRQSQEQMLRARTESLNASARSQNQAAICWGWSMKYWIWHALKVEKWHWHRKISICQSW